MKKLSFPTQLFLQITVISNLSAKSLVSLLSHNVCCYTQRQLHAFLGGGDGMLITFHLLLLNENNFGTEPYC